MIRSTVLGLLCPLLLGAGLASAQTPAQSNPAAPSPSPRTGCAPGMGHSTVGSGQPGANPSDKLARSNGVLCPPSSGVDPDMRVAPPQGGTMKVLPPPGMPGGDQKTIPK